MDPDFIQQSINILVRAASPSNEVQQEVIKSIEIMSKRRDFGVALGFVLATPSCGTSEVRQRAGLLLKTSIGRGIGIEQADAIRDFAIKAIADSEPVIRRAASSILTTLVTQFPSLPCSSTLHTLLKLILEGPPESADGAFDAVFKISEDIIEIWRQMTIGDSTDESQEGSKTMVNDYMVFSDAQLVPMTLRLSDARKKAKLLNLFATNFLFFPNIPLSKYLFPYFETLGTLAATERDGQTVSEVSKGLVYIARHHPDLYDNSLPVVIDFMLRASKNPEYNVRLDALQFWPVVTLNGDWLPALQPKLPDLLPVLLENMIYSQEDYLAMDEAVLVDDNAAIPDRPEEMAPRFHRQSDGGEELEDDEDDRENSTWGTDWTVRKAAASSLDHIATAFRDSILPVLLPLIETCLRSTNWEIQESSLLALGAIGHGCMQGLGPHLPSILQLLVSISNSTKPLLRSISCWTISRFASWIAFDTHRSEALPLVLSVILRRMMDQNKRVQEAAVSAFVNIEEEAGAYLEEFLQDVLKAIRSAMTYYQSKNLLILLDAVACLFDAIGPETMSKPEVVSHLVPPIFSAFKSVNFESEKQLSVSLFECITAIISCIGPSIGLDELTTAITRSGAVLEMNVAAYKRITLELSKEEKPDADILACSLDLLCAVIDGLSHAAPSVLSRMNFAPLACQLIGEFEPESRLPLVRNYFSTTVRQCAFALLGDLARCSMVYLPDDLLKPIIPICNSYVTIGPLSVSNNSSWALGEISMRKSSDFMAPFVPGICESLLTNLHRLEVGSRPLIRQNAAVALGRMGITCSTQLISTGAFTGMFSNWCMVMKKMRNDDEKISALHGFLRCIEQSPQTAVTRENLRNLHELIASLFPMPPELEGKLMNVVTMYRNILGQADWNSLWLSFPVEVQFRLNTAFNLGQPINQPSPPAL
jgi:hypothetical protein